MLKYDTCTYAIDFNFFSSLSDINECQSDICDVNANCTDSDGSFECSCNVGFTGDGFTCFGMSFYHTISDQRK